MIRKIVFIIMKLVSMVFILALLINMIIDEAYGLQFNVIGFLTLMIWTVTFGIISTMEEQLEWKKK